jgi:hypothetical protein
MNRGGHFTAMGIDRNTDATFLWNNYVYKQFLQGYVFAQLLLRQRGGNTQAAAASGRRLGRGAHYCHRSRRNTAAFR